jgi:hypothetical protein
MELLLYVPDSASHFVFAFDFESVISNSFEVLSGKPGAPLYLILQWQMYFLVQEL